MKDDDMIQMLRGAWLPPKACAKDSPYRLSHLTEGLDKDLVGALASPELLRAYALNGGQTRVILRQGGKGDALMYALVRALVIAGIGAKVVHLLDLENPPEERAGINFLEGLAGCEVLAILGFFDSSYPTPPDLRKIDYLMTRLGCRFLLQSSARLDKQTWWSPELIKNLSPFTYLNA